MGDGRDREGVKGESGGGGKGLTVKFTRVVRLVVGALAVEGDVGDLIRGKVELGCGDEFGWFDEGGGELVEVVDG